MSAQMPASVHVVTTTRNKHFVGLWLSSCLPAGTGGASGIASAAASATLPSLLHMGADVGSSLITLPPHRMGAAQRQGFWCGPVKSRLTLLLLLTDRFLLVQLLNLDDPLCATTTVNQGSWLGTCCRGVDAALHGNMHFQEQGLARAIMGSSVPGAR